MADAESIERFSRKGRRVLFVVAALLAIVAGGGLWVALTYGPLYAVAYVIGGSMLAGAVFPRLV